MVLTVYQREKKMSCGYAMATNQQQQQKKKQHNLFKYLDIFWMNGE